MFARLRKLKDRLTIWAILRLNVKLPDLQQTPAPKPGTIYYYYGRWVKLVKHNKVVNHDIDILNPDSLAEHICTGCALHRLGLPCKKVDALTPKDLCYTHYYKLIKGKANEET